MKKKRNYSEAKVEQIAAIVVSLVYSWDPASEPASLQEKRSL